MESKYMELIEELRRIAKFERDAATEFFYEPEYAVAIEKAADVIDTLSRGIHVYAKENEALIAWRRNAEEWMRKVADEKAAAYHKGEAMREAAPVVDEEKTPALSVLYLCDRRKCDRCNPECKHTEDVRHAKHFEVVPCGGCISEQEFRVW